MTSTSLGEMAIARPSPRRLAATVASPAPSRAARPSSCSLRAAADGRGASSHGLRARARASATPTARASASRQLPADHRRLPVRRHVRAHRHHADRLAAADDGRRRRPGAARPLEPRPLRLGDALHLLPAGSARRHRQLHALAVHPEPGPEPHRLPVERLRVHDPQPGRPAGPPAGHPRRHAVLPGRRHLARDRQRRPERHPRRGARGGGGRRRGTVGDGLARSCCRSSGPGSATCSCSTSRTGSSCSSSRR